MINLDYGTLLDASGVLFGIFGLILVFFARNIDEWPERLCIAILSAAVISTGCNLFESIALQYQLSLSLCEVFLLITTLVTPVPRLLVFSYFLYCCGEDYKKSTVAHIQRVLTAAFILSGWMAQLTGDIKVIMPDMKIHFGFWLILSLLFMAALIILSLTALLKRWKKLTNIHHVMFLICFLSSSPINIILMELYLIAELVHRYLMKREEAARQRTLLALTQMRPHFIYNTLSSIYYLCASDPKKAQKVIRDFSRYLQNNFTAIAEEGMIPFTKELEHTKAYLAVEQACYENRLFVEFHTPVTLFPIPPLTLQPVVENSIKHGLDPDSEPLSVSIFTKEIEQGILITVEDNGPGFAPVEDNEPHIALNNIRERLKIMCSGTLEISSLKAGGTRVTIFLPFL